MTTRDQTRMRGSEAAAILVWPAQIFVWLRRFARMAAGLRHPLPAPGPDVASTAAYYEPLIETLKLPDEGSLPLHDRFERRLAGEAEAIRRVAAIAARAVIAGYCEARTGNPAAMALRDQHAKQHGCLRASFVVADDLPADFRTAIFRPGARYEAIVRFSNAAGTPQSDRRPDGRGMAIKLLKVDGTSMLVDLTTPGSQLAHAGEQDFLLTNFPVFFAKDAADYSEFMEILAMPTARLSDRARKGVRFVGFFLRRPRQLGTFCRTALQPIRNPLLATYHSMTPYLFGPDKAVRYVAAPAHKLPARAPREWPRPMSWSFLRRAMASELDSARAAPAARAGTAFRFSVRVREMPRPEDVEDASRDWRGPMVREVVLARVEIPIQRFDTETHFLFGENLSFNPWNCLPDHRPLGSLNRMRLAVYLASSQVRHLLNLAGSRGGPET